VVDCSTLSLKAVHKEKGQRMKFFTKFKQAVEKWLRAIIADEVGKVDIELHLERAALCSSIKACDTQLNAAVDRLNELSYIKENAEQRETIKLLNERAQALLNNVKELHPELR
jgi:hypothetical protein